MESNDKQTPATADITTQTVHASIAANQALQDRRARLDRLWREGDLTVRALVQHPASIRHLTAPTLDELEAAVAAAGQR